MHKTIADLAKIIPNHGSANGSAAISKAVLRPSFSTNQTAKKHPGNEPRRKLEATQEPSICKWMRTVVILY